MGSSKRKNHLRGPTENEVVKSICDVLDVGVQQDRIWYFRTHGRIGNLIPDRPGIPDIVGGIRQEIAPSTYLMRLFGIEVKRPIGKATLMNEIILEIENHFIRTGFMPRVPDFNVETLPDGKEKRTKFSSTERDQMKELIYIRKRKGIGFVADDPQTVVRGLGLKYMIAPLFNQRERGES